MSVSLLLCVGTLLLPAYAQSTATGAGTTAASGEGVQCKTVRPTQLKDADPQTQADFLDALSLFPSEARADIVMVDAGSQQVYTTAPEGQEGSVLVQATDGDGSIGVYLDSDVECDSGPLQDAPPQH